MESQSVDDSSKKLDPLEAAESVKERIDTAIGSTASKIDNMAERLDQSARATQDAAEKVSGQMRQGAQYLESTSVDSLLNQVRDSIRRQPLTSVGLTLGLGYILARILKR